VVILRYSKSVKYTVPLRNLLRNGTVVAGPTETAYGLLASAVNKPAVSEVVRLKGRNEHKPIALVAADLRMVQQYFRLSSDELRLAKKFWPGALTLLLKPRRKFPLAVIGISGRVGVRVPGSVWLRKFCAAVGVPLTATSANRAGASTPYSATEVISQLGRRGLRYIIDGGRLLKRPTSTVVLASRGTLTVVRRGMISQQRLHKVMR